MEGLDTSGDEPVSVSARSHEGEALTAASTTSPRYSSYVIIHYVFLLYALFCRLLNWTTTNVHLAHGSTELAAKQRSSEEDSVPESRLLHEAAAQQAMIKSDTFPPGLELAPPTPSSSSPLSDITNANDTDTNSSDGKVVARRRSNRHIKSPSFPNTPSPSPSTSSNLIKSSPRKPLKPPSSYFVTKTLVLDLDETLIHSTSRGFASSSRRYGRNNHQSHMIEVMVDKRSCLYYVHKRPHVDYFLKKVCEWYKVIIFTASMAEYADPVIDWLEQGRKMFGGRLFRQSCTTHNGTYLKDLTIVNPDLSKVALIDNSPASYALNRENAIPIEGWISDPNDEALLDLLPFLDALRFLEDVRSVLRLRAVGGPRHEACVPADVDWVKEQAI